MFKANNKDTRTSPVVLVPFKLCSSISVVNFEQVNVGWGYKIRRTLLKGSLYIQNQPPEVFCKKVFLEILQNSQENTCARVSFLIKLQSCGLQLY